MKLLACVVKGCPWRGPSSHGCPMHREEDEREWEWQKQRELRPRKTPRGLMRGQHG